MLLCLGTHASEDGVVSLTVAEIAELTSINRKTVIHARQRLVRAGLLVEAAARRGRTRQIKVNVIAGARAVDTTSEASRT